MSTWPKRCTMCGEDIYQGEWQHLPLCGYQDDGFGGRLELRNHDCGTTLSIEVTPAGPTELMLYEIASVFEAQAREVGGLPEPYAWPPTPKRDVSEADMAESARLYAIADELYAKARSSSHSAPSEAA